MKPEAPKTVSPIMDAALSTYKQCKADLDSARDMEAAARRQLIAASFPDQDPSELEGSKTITYTDGTKASFTFKQNSTVDRDTLPSVLEELGDLGVDLFTYTPKLNLKAWKALPTPEQVIASEAVTFKPALTGVSIKEVE